MIVPDKRNAANKKKYGKANPPRAQPKRPVRVGTDSAIEKAVKKAGADVREFLKKPAEWLESLDKKRWFLTNFPYLLIGCAVDKVAWLYRNNPGSTDFEKALETLNHLEQIFEMPVLSIYPMDILAGIAGGVLVKVIVYYRGKNAKKYRHGEEYGSARWGTAKDMQPYMDPIFEKNIILTATEFLMMSGRPKLPKYARNKNVLVIGGSGSGKTRFFVKPNIMQMHSSYVITDPKGTVLIEVGKLLSRGCPKTDENGKVLRDKKGKVIYEAYRIKVFNTINFRKSMHYNPFHYIRSEKDILKLVNTIIMNTKGEGEKSTEDFWVKSERLLYAAYIGYIWYEGSEEDKNFNTLLAMLNASEAREDDEEFQNPVDLMFEELEKEKPDHFAVRQYKKYKLAAGVVS